MYILWKNIKLIRQNDYSINGKYLQDFEYKFYAALDFSARSLRLLGRNDNKKRGVAFLLQRRVRYFK